MRPEIKEEKIELEQKKLKIRTMKDEELMYAYDKSNMADKKLYATELKIRGFMG